MVNKMEEKNLSIMNELRNKPESLLPAPENQRLESDIKHSLPHLVVLPPAESYTNLEKISRFWHKMGNADDSMMVAISAFYAKFVIVLGLALPITSTLHKDVRINFATDAFTIYLYVVSLVFIGYIFYHLKLSKNNKSRVQKHYGSFYLHMGITGFSVGSVVYSCLQFGEYFDLNGECQHVMIALRPIVKIFFTVAQTIFIFSYTDQVLEPARGVVLDRFGLMHLIATNICEWLNVVIQEAKDDMLSISYGINTVSSKYTVSEDVTCNLTYMIAPIITTVKPYLRPCGVEYSLLSSIIVVVMWKDLSRVSSRIGRNLPIVLIDEHSLKPMKQPKQFSVDCAQAQKGLFSGLALLAGTIVSLLLFNGLFHHAEFEELALFQINVWETVLFAVTTLGSILCLTRMRVLALRATNMTMPLEHALLLAMQCGVFLYYLFQIIGVSFMFHEFSEYRRATRIIAPVCALVQSSLQTLVVLDAWGRKCSSDQYTTKPGRQLITFLLVSNYALWILNRVKNLRAEFHPIQMDFYGVSAWTLITHVSVPLVVCYRFQATVCFYEIWKNVYKTKRRGNLNKEETIELNSP